MPEITKPEVGDKIYIPSEMYIDRGENDIAGGAAVIAAVYDKRDTYWVSFVGFPPSRTWNYKFLLEEQDKLSEEYAGQEARPDPDYGGNTGGNWSSQ